MIDRAIDNPIPNAPFVVPSRYWRFDDDGITNESVQGRRKSEYFIPVPQAQRLSGQLSLASDWTSDRLLANEQINQIRGKVEVWRRMGRPGTTATTKALIAHWTASDRARPLFFCQIEAVETAIWITEVASKGDPWVANSLRESNSAYNSGLPRMSHKMATGSGKTTVMAMLIAWHTCNKAANPMDKRFSHAFLVVAPGLTIRDRLRVLLPSDPQSYYRVMDMVPVDLLPALERARVSIVNFHTFGQRETGGVTTAGKLTKSLLTTPGSQSPFVETPAQMARRVCRDLASRSGGKQNIIVLNDEAHHCWQGPATPEVEKLVGEERKEAEARSREAHMWISGLKAINDKFGIRQVYDLSATPFFLKGSGYGEGTLFPWVVSDFSLIDAIECGIVKIPRLPVADNADPADMPTYRDLWPRIREGLPKKGRRALDGGTEPELPNELQGALHSLYGNYKRSYERWAASESALSGSTPPVFIVVCNNTSVSKLVYDYISGWTKTLPDGVTTSAQSGALPLLRNDDERGGWLHRPRTILVDSEELESGEAMSLEFKQIAASEITDFRDDYRARFPGRDAEQLTDEDLLREVMNTVGKRGKLGEHVRCVVSVNMLTEGWDANTVTHVLGVRAFGTQLLCEQVVGRALRRRSYALDEKTGHFAPEYAEVYGVPFSFLPSAGSTADPKPGRPVVYVRALPEREHLRITYPRVAGYRYDVRDKHLKALFDDDSRLTLTVSDVPTETEVRGVVGEVELHNLDDLAVVRPQQIAYELARTALGRFRDEARNEPFWLFPQLLGIAREWIRTQLDVKDHAFTGLVLLAEHKADAVDRIYQAVVRGTSVVGEPKPRLLPIYRPYEPEGSTDYVAFDTTREVYETDPHKSHVSHVTKHSGWEETVAKAIEDTRGVRSYVKNDRLGFLIPYTHEGEAHNYEPDFLVSVEIPDGTPPLTLIVEVSGEKRADKAAKVGYARNLWVPAVNNDSRYGKWAIVEISDQHAALAVLKQTIGDLLASHGKAA